jgi:MoaA/NifB/PqqE/SkfB family radical SAM enzyme
VKERNFADIWQDRSDPLMDGLKSQPRPLEGRCGKCSYLDVCGGNTRVRAYQLTNNFWAEDPACYLFDNEIGIEQSSERLKVTPWSRASENKKKKA